jgi:hypothetical protein
VLVLQEQTISVGLAARTSLPVQFVLQAPNFESLKKVLPQFLDEATKNPIFGGIVDVKPEIQQA